MAEDAFKIRTLLAISDWAQSVTQLGALANPTAARAQRVVAQLGFNDVDAATQDDLDKLAVAPNPADFTGSLLRAFWRERIRHGFKLHPIKGVCLLINPPEGLTPLPKNCATLTSQKFLTGQYGAPLLNNTSLTPVQWLALGDHCFDEVLAFWDFQLEPGPAMAFLKPGSTVALYRPWLEQHQFWLEWVKFDYGFPRLVDEIVRRYQTRLVHSATEVEVMLHVFGVEALRPPG